LEVDGLTISFNSLFPSRSSFTTNLRNGIQIADQRKSHKAKCLLVQTNGKKLSCQNEVVNQAYSKFAVCIQLKYDNFGTCTCAMHVKPIFFGTTQLFWYCIVNVYSTKHVRNELYCLYKKLFLVIFSFFLLALNTVFESISDDEDFSDATVQERHYTALNKEQKKRKPNKSVINIYLNAEFVSRRQCFETTPKEGRPRKVLDDYPCLKDPYEVCKNTYK
jgi:hypothetical protein